VTDPEKQLFWHGLFVAATMLIAARGDLIQSLERKAYDLGVQAATRASAAAARTA